MTTTPHPARSIGSELPFALVTQSVILVLASMILDGGGIAQVCFYAFVAFWSGVLVLRFHRRGALSRVDLLLIRYGYILVCIISFFITRWIWHWRGFGQYL
jgi:hypothetical protein